MQWDTHSDVLPAWEHTEAHTSITRTRQQQRGNACVSSEGESSSESSVLFVCGSECGRERERQPAAHSTALSHSVSSACFNSS